MEILGLAGGNEVLENHIAVDQKFLDPLIDRNGHNDLNFLRMGPPTPGLLAGGIPSRGRDLH